MRETEEESWEGAGHRRRVSTGRMLSIAAFSSAACRPPAPTRARAHTHITNQVREGEGERGESVGEVEEGGTWSSETALWAGTWHSIRSSLTCSPLISAPSSSCTADVWRGGGGGGGSDLALAVGVAVAVVDEDDGGGAGGVEGGALLLDELRHARQVLALPAHPDDRPLLVPDPQEVAGGGVEDAERVLVGVDDLLPRHLVRRRLVDPHQPVLVRHVPHHLGGRQSPHTHTR
eukprot:2543704-Rhodomonas_salina.1